MGGARLAGAALHGGGELREARAVWHGCAAVHEPLARLGRLPGVRGAELRLEVRGSRREADGVDERDPDLYGVRDAACPISTG